MRSTHRGRTCSPSWRTTPSYTASWPYEKLQDGTKIRHAREAITKGVGAIYDATIANAEERCRTSNPPTRLKWDTFVDVMVAASIRINTQATTGSSGYGAGAVKGPPSDNETYGHTPIDRDQPDIQAIVSSLAALTVQLGKLLPGMMPTPATAQGTTGVPLPRQYCHTHGLCAHNGKQCKASKHTIKQQAATLQNKMGGVD